MPRFEDLIVSLQDFFAYCDGLALGSEARRGRFGSYQTQIRELQAEINKGDREEDMYRTLQARLPSFLVALAEASEIRSFLPFLNSALASGIHSQLRAILSGPELPSDESSSSNQARNIQFELWLASILWKAGISVELAEPDLRCQMGDLIVLIACKRLFSPFKLQKRISEAVRQLERSTEALGSLNGGGLIAISLSRVLGSTESTTHIANQADGITILERRIDSFIARRATTWRASREAQGIIFHVTSITTNSETNRLETGGFLKLYGNGPACEAIAPILEKVAVGTNSPRSQV